MIEKDLEKARNSPKSPEKALFGPEKVEKCTKNQLKKIQNRRLELGDEESQRKMKARRQALIFFF